MSTSAGPEDGYRPTFALAYWDTIGPFITTAVQDAAASSGRPELSLYPAATAFVLWCWQSRGTPLERGRIFRRPVVEEFIHRGMGRYASGSRATHRATLALMVKELNPADAYAERRPIPRSKPTAPYLPIEVAELHSWATNQGTEHRRNDALALLALGLGAGLATRELLGIRGCDVDQRSGDMLLIVWEGRPRVVPVLPEWQQPLARVLNDREGSTWLFRPGRTATSPGQVTDFLLRSRTELDVRPSRMRATWLLHHVMTGTPIPQLLAISGLKQLAALDKITSFAPRTRHNPP